MGSCTWQDCTQLVPQIAKDGSQWADLCAAHAQELEDNLLDAKGVLRCWVRAQGGAKAAAERMAIDASVKLAQVLTTLHHGR